MPGTPGFFGDVLLRVKEFARARWAVEVAMSLQHADGMTHQWRPDGMLIYSSGADWQPLIERLGTPVVLIGGDALPHLPRILTDDAAIGRTAANYFLRRGFRHFAYCGYAQALSGRREGG